MLYRTPRSSFSEMARRLGHRLLAALVAFHRGGVDAACLDALRDEQLRDLGIHRIETRDGRYYR